MADGSLWRFHEFILGVRDNGPQGWGEPELLSLLERNPAIVAELRDVGRPGAHRVDADQELLWATAMGRLADILIAPHQPVDDDPALLAWTTREAWWSGPLPAPGAWAAFRRAVGASAIAEDEFHPFFHEIVEVRPDEDPDQPPVLVGEHWPGAMIGGLLLARAGVTVRAGARRMDPVVAARSCMYWAWWRRNRVVRDLSHGWGHNSQWRTDFRRTTSSVTSFTTTSTGSGSTPPPCRQRPGPDRGRPAGPPPIPAQRARGPGR